MNDWKARAECRGVDPTVFHPELNAGNNSEVTQRQMRRFNQLVSEALAYCDVCSVRRECEEYANEQRIQIGIYGGKVRNKKNTRTEVIKRLCKICDKPTQPPFHNYCSTECRAQGHRRSKRRSYRRSKEYVGNNS